MFGKTVRALLPLVVYAVLFLILFLPLLSSQHLPSMDGMSHIDNARKISRVYFDTDGVEAQYYHLNPNPSANWPSHLALALLLRYLAPENAEKLLAAAYLLSFPLAAGCLMSAFGRAPTLFFAVFALPLAPNALFYRGFYNFNLSVVCFLLFCGYWVRRRDRRSAAHYCVVALFWLALALTHIFSLFAAFLFLALFELHFVLHEWKKKRLSTLAPAAVLCTACLPAVLLTIPFFHGAPLTLPWLPDPRDRLHDLLFLELLDVFTGWEKLKGFALFIALLLLAASLLSKHKVPDRPIPAALRSFFLVLLLLYFVTPQSFAGGYYLSSRLLLYLILALLIWAAHEELLTGRGAVVAVLLLILNTLLYTGLHRQTEVLYQEAFSGNDVIEPGCTLLAAVFSPNGEGGARANLPFFLHFDSFVAAKRNCINLLNYEPAKRQFPLLYNPSKERLPLLLRDPHGNEKGTPDIPLAEYQAYGQAVDYVLVWGRKSTVPLFSDLQQYQLVFRSKSRLLEIFKRR